MSGRTPDAALPETGDPAGTAALVVAANRLPSRWDEETQSWRTSPGGLVSALRPILEERRGVWVGWTGMAGPPIAPFTREGIEHHPIGLDESEVEAYYRGFCNATIWPLYHNAIRTPEYHRHWFRPYREVNERFSDRIARALRPDGVAWIHDYHLQLTPAGVRERVPDASIGFFLHIPFPPIELFGYLPWRRDILRGLLGSDVVMFQTPKSAENFVEAACRFTGTRPTPDGVFDDGREIRVEPHGISVDAASLETLAADPDVRRHAADIRERMGAEQVLLGVDRLDYTKGIGARLKAIETFFERDPERASKCAFLQIAVPTREHVPEYVEMREAVERLIGRINGRFGRPGYTPVTYAYRSLPLDELVACYLAADVMLVTPFCDGMNLVAKEYVAVRRDETGVLILSEFAGAAAELEQALLVNPCDVNWMAETMVRALSLSADEQRERMAALRARVLACDVFDWAEGCLATLGDGNGAT